MYAAAAGASLGSRQARKQQRIQNTKNAALLQQTLKDKLAAAKELHTPTKSRQFHQLPANYLRTPAGQARKASIGQQSTSNSRLLLPITEMSSVASSTKNLHQLDLLQQHPYRGHHLQKSPHHSRHASFNHHKSRGHLSGSCSGSSRDCHHHSSRPSPSSNKRNHHHHHPAQHHYHLNLNPDCAIHGSYSQLLLTPGQRLNRSATATLPLNNLNTPPSTPLSRHPKHLDPNSSLLAPLLGDHHHPNNSHNKFSSPHRKSFSTLQLVAVPDNEVDLRRRESSFHPIDPIIITPATPLPSPHKHVQEELGAVGGRVTVAGAGGGVSDGSSADQEEGAAAASAKNNVLLIDLHPSTPLLTTTTAMHKSTDNLSRCESPIEPPQLERKCSVYRPKPGPEQKYYYYDDESKWNENDTYYDSYGRTIKNPDSEPCSYDLMVPTFGVTVAELQHQQQQGNSWISPEYFCETAKMGRKHSTGVCTCDQVECAQGKAAWLERGRRCSVQDQNAASCHRRWVKRNRIHDSSLGGSSDEDDFLSVLRGPSSFANAFLYVGLGTVAIGLIISFVGTGEKGFKTVELRLIGPSLIGIGLICCILRILFCICPSTCITNRKKKKTNKVDADYTTSLLRGEGTTNGRSGGGGGSIKRVQIARGPNSLQKFPSTHSSHRLTKTNSKTMEGMEALRQIATTSLLMQGGGGGAMSKEAAEQLQLQQSSSMTGRRQAFTSSSTSSSLKRGNNRIVPIIKEPPGSILDDQEDVKRFDAMSVDIFNLSDGDDEDEDDDDDDEEEEEDEEANSSSMRSPDEDSKASVIHRIIEPGPSNQVALRTGAPITILSTVNEKNHTEVEPGGSRTVGGISSSSGAVKKTMTTVAEVEQQRNNSYSSVTKINSNSVYDATGTESSSTSGANKLSRDRPSLNLGAIAKRPSGSRLTTTSPPPPSTTRTKQTTPSSGSRSSNLTTPTTLLDAVLIETSLCEPISPSFTIKLDIERHQIPSSLSQFPTSASAGNNSTSFPFPPKSTATTVPGAKTSFSFSGGGVYPLTSMQPPPRSVPTGTSGGGSSSSRTSTANKFSYQLLSPPGARQTMNNSNSSKSNGTNGASAGELELVLSPAKLGQ